jgi:serine phosphatase RsbU (regulator of sigma subunit)/CHASE1-domain containing sensor protein
VVAVIVIGTTAAWATARGTQENAVQREELVADQTANLVTATVQQLLAAISGVSGLSDRSGHVDEMAFDAYARGAVGASPFQTLAYVTVVPAADRPAFEAAIERPISDVPGGAPAGEREWYLPVQRVTPPLKTTRDLIGLDLATDPVRRGAAEDARDRGSTVITRTVPSQPTGQPAVFLVHPIYLPGTDPNASEADRREALVGYVTTAVTGAALLEAVDTHVADPLGIRIEDVTGSTGEQRIVLAESDPAPAGGTTVERTAGGRGWRITVDDRQPAGTGARWWILAGTVALALALGVLARRAVRHQREVDRHVAMVERIAAFGRSLTAAGSVDDLSRVVEAEVPAVLGADAARFREQTAGDGAAGSAAPRLPGVVVARRITDEAGTTVASLEVSWAQGRDLDDLTLASLSTVGEMCGQTLVRARLADAARRNAVSSRLLAGLAEAASTAGTTDQVARKLVERAAEVPGAKSAHIGLLSDDGHALMVVHEGLGSSANRIDVRPLDHPWPIVQAFRRSGPVLLGDLDAVTERFPEIIDGMRAAGLVAVACLPLVGEDGRPFGALSLAWAEPQRFDAELVDVLRTTADLCAASLGRARATDQAQARSSALATLAGHLSASTSFDDVGGAIIEHATPALGADFALVGMVEGDRFHLLAPSGQHLNVLAPYTDIDLDSDFPALISWRQRDLVTFSSLDEVPDATVATDLGRMGLHAGACAPLIGSDGAATGVFVVLWAEPPQFDHALLARISTVADLCAQSAERSRLFDAEHRVRRDLQRSVLPDAPVVEGLDVATRYRPAARSVGMGGDWYDAITLEGGRLCLVVGDVSGHGIGAIAEMTQVRTVVHTLVAGGMPLPEILVRTSAVMQRDALGYATVLVAVVDPQSGSLSYVTAGHPPPLVRRPGGTVDTLTGGRHSVLGIDLVPKPPGYVSFPVGSTLVIYTDGLIERPGTAIDVSIVSLADELRAASTDSADALADHLLGGQATAGTSRDDVALVVARRTR